MLLPVAVVRLNAVGWGEGPWALVTPVKAIRVGVGFLKNNDFQPSSIMCWDLNSRPLEHESPPLTTRMPEVYLHYKLMWFYVVKDLIIFGLLNFCLKTFSSKIILRLDLVFTKSCFKKFCLKIIFETF